MVINIICPIYNGENYIVNLNNSLIAQEIDEEVNITYILTESNDNSERILNDINAQYEKIKKNEFSHSLTREKFIYKLGGDISVLITQDIVIKDRVWLKNLINPIKNNECVATFSRQISKYNNIEKYTREYNYKAESRIVSKGDVEKLGLYTFFFSDASSAIKVEIYKELNGYDKKNLIISEDMYIARKIIDSGYKIGYCSDSIIYHSHKFKMKDLMKRYFDTGVFFAKNIEFKKYSGNSNGIKMVKYIFKRCVEERNIKCLITIIPDFGSRFIGSNLGKNYEKLNKRIVKKLTLNKSYWNEQEV